MKIEKHWLIEQSETTVIDWLSTHCPEISRQQLKQAMQFGAVWRSQGKQVKRVRRAKKCLNVGDELHLYFDSNILKSQSAPAELIVDEQAYSIWNKPYGMYSQGTKWGDHTAICRWVEMYGLTERPALLVHRLDRATSGLIIIAHNKKAARALISLFEKRQIVKRYTAKVAGDVSSVIGANNLPYLIDSPIERKKALTKILSVDYSTEENTSVLLLEIETGRKHQIRIHLASLGFPIIGDRLHGNERSEWTSNETQDLQLTSCYLSFECPMTSEAKVYRLPA